MSGDEQPPGELPNASSHLPQTLTETIDYLKIRVLHRLNQEVMQQQLLYHTVDHVRAVQRRSQQIFAVVASALPPPVDRPHLQQLIDLCALAHDMVQQFEPTDQLHATRQRRSGASELATVDQLISDINGLHCQLGPSRDHPAKLTDADITVIQQTIRATICVYDPQEQAIYQPLLYSDEPLSIVSRILALADLGTLGMEGIEAYNREGGLLFLEENLDVMTLLCQGALDSLEATDPILAENVRQRLLKRCRFQVSFAKSRLARLPQELQGFPASTLPQLATEIFPYLSPATIQTVTAHTPTADDTSLKALLQFFQFEQYRALCPPRTTHTKYV